MTNIWTNTFEDIRKPHFEMEDPYTSLQEKKEGKEVKKWWDDDGDGKGYEEGEVSGKFKKKKKVEEEVEQIDEISLKTKIKAYSASRDVDADYAYGSKVHDQGDRIKKAIVKKHGEKAGEHAERSAETQNFGRGTPRAKPRIEKNRTYRTTKAGSMHGQDQAKLKSDLIKRRNEEYMDEAQVANRDPDKYESGEKKKYAPVRGERTPMPPRGNKKREDFEKWYAANVKEETLYTSKSSQQKIDVRKGIKNKIDTKPTTSEEVETWVAELVAEGYDLSEFTWEEMTDIYLDEAGTSAMAPRGDYQTTTATATQKQDPNAPLIAAKAKAAKAKVTKEIADLQVAKQSQRMKVDTNESVILYLAHRPDAFANLEEGVFDPKKSKMRSSSERSERTMTSAQRAAAKKEGERTAKIHSKGETVLAGLTKPQRKSSQPMGTTQSSKPAAPEANRKVTGKYDQLAKKASAILKSVKDK
jgi:hypothetical protein